MDALRLARLHDRRRERIRRFHGDALQREVDLERAGERLRLFDADLRSDKGMLAGPEDHALGGADRLVAWISCDLNEAYGDARLRRLILRESEIYKICGNNSHEYQSHPANHR